MTSPARATEHPPEVKDRDLLFRIRLVTALLVSGDGPLLRKHTAQQAPVCVENIPTGPEEDLPPVKIGGWDPCFKAGPCPCSSLCRWAEPLILPDGGR